MKPILLLAMGIITAPVLGAPEVDLVLRTGSANIRVGDTIDVDLYAVSTTVEDIPLLGLDVILAWDADALELSGVAGGVLFNSQGFPDDENLDGLNADCGPVTFCDPPASLPFNDGDALYQTIYFETPLYPFAPEATPEGLLVETFHFVATAPMASAQLGIAASMGELTTSRVVRDLPEGFAIVTGTLGTLTVQIAPCGTMGDFNWSCTVDLWEYQFFVACLAGPGIEGDCPTMDFDSDGFIDLRDAAGFQQWFTGQQ